MNFITETFLHRRRIIIGIVALFVPTSTRTVFAEDISIGAVDGAVGLTRYAADGVKQRPAVLILHGARGIELKPLAYERYAKALSAVGIDVYLVHYFTQADRQALNPKTTTTEIRDAYETGRFESWAKQISSVVTAILARHESSGRIGLLGFSLGSYVAAVTAAQDRQITAIAAMYGGMPDTMVSRVKHMPPLIELHGDADRVVPLSKGEELVKLAESVGAPAQQIIYPGRAHGFDFADDDPMTADAIRHVVQFFHERLFTE